MESVVEIGTWVLKIDRALTMAAYAQLPRLSECCCCAYCRNYVAASHELPPAFLSLLNQLGVDPTKECELYELGQEDDRTHEYGGFYHFVGRMLDGPRHSGVIRLADDWLISVTTVVTHAPPGFPPPILQLEFTGCVPWCP